MSSDASDPIEIVEARIQAAMAPLVRDLAATREQALELHKLTEQQAAVREAEAQRREDEHRARGRRDFFACEAMSAMLMRGNLVDPPAIAALAYRVADAMVAQAGGAR